MGRNHVVENGEHGRRTMVAGAAKDRQAEATFAVFAEAMRADLGPTGVYEEFLASQMIAAAFRLQRAQKGLGHGDRGEPKGRSPIEAAAERSFFRFLGLFEACRSLRWSRWGTAAPADSKAGAILGENAKPAFAAELDRSAHSFAAALEEDFADPTDAEPLEGWTHRLVFDPSVSDESPVVRGTNLTANTVISRIVDGWTWSEILHHHPELTEADIRACLDFTLEHADGAAPF
jgi:uncharacterized protein (DUF433 family)